MNKIFNLLRAHLIDINEATGRKIRVIHAVDKVIVKEGYKGYDWQLTIKDEEGAIAFLEDFYDQLEMALKKAEKDED